MATGVYAIWQDVKAFLDTDVFKETDGGSEGPIPADGAALQSFIRAETEDFESWAKGRVKVPIDEAESPDTFDCAKTIIASRAAAAYAKKLLQTEGRSIQTWYFDWLDTVGERALARFLDPHRAPEDAGAADHPMEYLPRAGIVPVEGDGSRFGLHNITSGPGHW